ncbi:MAG: N-acetylmuramoyl-L-alanine amidase family protein [Clostridia bacterium]|nr:N-acetylmuramoyl-L-alanine amidase family protein [Clostridia bacterium]
MKKIISIILSIALFLSFSEQAFAQTLLLNYDGKVHKYAGKLITLKVNNQTISTDIPPIILNSRTLVPARAVFEKLGASVNWDAKNSKVQISLNNTKVELKINDTNAKVNNKTVKLDTPAKIINNRTMIPVRFVGEQLNMVVGWYPDKDMVTIDNKKENVKNILKGVSALKTGGNDQVVISADNYENYNIFKLASPDRIVVDIPNTIVSAKKRIEVNGKQLESIRYAQFDETTARVVLDMTSAMNYNVEEKPGQLILAFDSIKEPAQDRGDNSPGSATPDEKDADSAENIAIVNGKVNIECTSEGSGDRISINLDNYKGYNVFRLSGPDRIVLDIPGNALTDKKEYKLDYSGSLVKSVRYAQKGSDSLRIVLDVNGQPQYKVVEKKGKLEIYVETPTYRNVFYGNNGDRVYLTLGGVELTEGGEELKKLYKEKFSSSGKQYTITFPAEIADIGTGVMQINDSYLESIEILEDPESKETSIVFNAKDKFFFEVITRYDVDDTAITILKPAAKSDRLVVIDPGHGGRDPGAMYGGITEKELNLDIAKRLNQLLKEKNIKTYMTREDDSFVGLYERAYIANNLNASLFLSIHNNAIADPNYGGTMTLYFPPSKESSGLNGKRFAQLIQDSLLARLGTTDRKIIERPKLVVLKATAMPSALAEIGFMTNSRDRENLLKEEFRQNAAEALCQAVLQALTEIK